MEQLVSNLLIYGDLPKNSILMQLAMVFKDFHSNDYDKTDLTTRIYKQIKRILELGTDYAFDKNLWHNYLTYLLIMQENPFSLTCEKVGSKDGSVNHFAKSDFGVYKKLFEYDFSEIEDALEIDCFSCITDYKAIEKPELMYNHNVSEKVRSLSEKLEKAADENEFFDIVTNFYKEIGVGAFGLNKAFRLNEGKDGKILFSSINNMDSVVLDDLVGYGQFGLLDAISKYDTSKNVKFKTYAVTRIRGAIFDELRQMDWVPRSVRQKSREIEDAIVSLESRLGRPASDSEIADSLNMTEDEYHRTIMKISGTSILSLNDVWYAGDDNDNMSIGNNIESPASLNPDVIAEREEIRKVIAQAISELPEKEKMVIVLYYHEDLTFKEIGEVLEVSESRISQLHTKANLRLRAKLTNLRKGII